MPNPHAKLELSEGRLIEAIRNAGGTMHIEELLKAFPGEERWCLFALGSLWQEQRVHLTNGLSTISLAGIEARDHDHMMCLTAGQPGHFGCGVCEHNVLYKHCSPCLSKRIEEATAAAAR